MEKLYCIFDKDGRMYTKRGTVEHDGKTFSLETIFVMRCDEDVTTALIQDKDFVAEELNLKEVEVLLRVVEEKE